MSKRGKRYRNYKESIKDTIYNIDDAIKSFKDGKGKFDETQI